MFSRNSKKEFQAPDSVPLELAERVLDAARRKAEDLRIREDIAIVDAGGNLKAFIRMDGAWLGSIDVAIRKARTARLFDMETEDLGKMSQPGEPLYGIQVSNGGVIIFAGGIPLEDRDGNIVGAIGASGRMMCDGYLAL